MSKKKRDLKVGKMGKSVDIYEVREWESFVSCYLTKIKEEAWNLLFWF